MVAVKKKELRRAYEKAVREGKNQFTIKGLAFVTAFAKYLLQHLDNIKVAEEHIIQFNQKAEDNCPTTGCR